MSWVIRARLPGRQWWYWIGPHDETLKRRWGWMGDREEAFKFKTKEEATRKAVMLRLEPGVKAEAELVVTKLRNCHGLDA